MQLFSNETKDADGLALPRHCCIMDSLDPAAPPPGYDDDCKQKGAAHSDGHH
jgi:hypothetical protein